MVNLPIIQTSETASHLPLCLSHTADPNVSLFLFVLLQSNISFLSYCVKDYIPFSNATPMSSNFYDFILLFPP